MIVHYVIPAPLSLDENRRRAQDGLPHVKAPDAEYFDEYLKTVLVRTAYTPESRIVWLLRSKTITGERVGKTIVHLLQLDNAKPDYDKINNFINENLVIG